MSDQRIGGLVIRTNNQTEFSKINFEEEKDRKLIVTTGKEY